MVRVSKCAQLHTATHLSRHVRTSGENEDLSGETVFFDELSVFRLLCTLCREQIKCYIQLSCTPFPLIKQGLFYFACCGHIETGRRLQTRYIRGLRFTTPYVQNIMHVPNLHKTKITPAHIDLDYIYSGGVADLYPQ